VSWRSCDLLHSCDYNFIDYSFAAGTGKTILAHVPTFYSAVDLLTAGHRSIVVDNLRQRGLDVGVAVMYCNYKEKDAQTLENLMASLWRQLVLGRSMSIEAKDLYKKHDERRTRPSVGEIMKVLRSEIGGYPKSKVFIVVDALDECREDVRQGLVTQLEALRPSVQLMVTSRPHIPSEFSSAELEVRATDDDLRDYVDARIRDRDRLLAKHLEGREELRNDIRKRVVENADGMYVT
jgi:hypothetical protein